MFYFPFYTPNGFCPPPFPFESESPIQSNPPISSLTISTKQCEQSFTENGSKQADIQNLIITKEDLQDFGYVPLRNIWTQEEDKLLLHYKDQLRLEWSEILMHMGGRNKKMCQCRYRRLKMTPRDQWLKKNDEELKQYVEQLGQNWEQIAKRFKNRNARQVRDRYNNYLRPGVSDDEWSLREDLLILDLVKTYGKNWKLLKERLPKRNLTQIKYRFYSRIKRLNDRKLKKLMLAEDSKA